MFEPETAHLLRCVLRFVPHVRESTLRYEARTRLASEPFPAQTPPLTR
jgi:hypothetical protein